MEAEAGLFDDFYHPVPGRAGDPVRRHLPASAHVTSLRALPGKFSVLVGDQGEPGHPPQGDFNGDLFSIELIDGAYNGYTRGGYIEGGNIQVDNLRRLSGGVAWLRTSTPPEPGRLPRFFVTWSAFRRGFWRELLLLRCLKGPRTRG